MGGMTNSHATKRNRQTNGQNVQFSPSQMGMPLERRPFYQGMQNQFADPYIASPDTPEGRDTLQRAEYRPVPDTSIEADARRLITPILEMVASRDLMPAEIPGEFFLTVNAEDQLRICRYLSILLSHSAAGVYRHVYGDFNKARNIKNNKGTALGTIGIGPITEVLYDFGVGVHDTDRANSTQGATIGDRRPFILLDKGSHGEETKPTLRESNVDEGHVGSGDPVTAHAQEPRHVPSPPESIQDPHYLA
ncbi:hypothetical protein KC330_g2254 [Hortaea werneckii]|nr:hypothetical protein KC330_g2254 [Hortaea werneckii]